MADPAAILEIIHPEDRDLVKETYHQIVDGTDQRNLEFRLQLSDLSMRWLCVTPFLLEKEESGQQLLVGSAQDITHNKEHQEVLQKFSSKKNAILEILSHDLARPLANIKGLSTLLAKRLKPSGEEEVAELVEMISQASERGILLIREFIQEEFLASANVELIKERVDIVEKLGIVIEQYQASQQDMAKTFQLFTNQEPIFCEIDEPKFMQAINNLLSNAIKFTPDGGVINLRLEEQADQVLIQIEDNGIGIPDHLQEKIFEKFSKARRPGLKGEPSTGLGMSIIKTIIEWHGGRIWLESEENKGTTFFIELPR